MSRKKRISQPRPRKSERGSPAGGGGQSYVGTGGKILRTTEYLPGSNLKTTKKKHLGHQRKGAKLGLKKRWGNPMGVPHI